MKHNLILIDISSFEESKVFHMMTMLKERYQVESVFLESSTTEKIPLTSNMKAFLGNYYLDSAEKIVIHEGRVIKLTHKERDLLEILISYAGEVVTFDEIIEHVWKHTKATKNSVRTLVYRLRDKFDEDIIEGLSCTGYKI